MRNKMSTNSKDELLEIDHPMYQEAQRKGKGEILNAFVQAASLLLQRVVFNTLKAKSPESMMGIGSLLISLGELQI